MSYPIKFLSLQKSELEYEVGLRGETPSTTVADLRKQIIKLSRWLPSEDILYSHLDPTVDLSSSLELLEKVRAIVDAETTDRNILSRTENLFHHLYHRLSRISTDEKTSQQHAECSAFFKQLYESFLNLKKKGVDPLSLPGSSDSHSQSSVPIHVSVTCDSGSRISELNRLKFDGKTCVRSFIQRASEYSEARNISDTKLLSFATEIFVDDALHWFRSVKEQVSTWDELVVLLRQDFDKTDYDYRLLSEIRSRTQGELENITIYLSILSSMFARLSKPLLEEDKLEIILHNIRPCYASTLASATEINTISQLRTLCRNFENVQARLVHFREPPAATSDTIAPEFAYKSKTNTFNKQKQNFNQTSVSHNDFRNKQQSTYNMKPNTTNVNDKYLHAINAGESNSDTKQPYCPRCRNNSHSLNNCQNSEILCFKCGFKGVKKPDCPTCSNNSKN